MENTGWIKLYRKARNNPIIKDMRAWQVFCWILLSVDRKTGKMTLGRKWASETLQMKSGTFYKVLLRLEKRYHVVRLVTRKVTIKYTEVSVLNWDKYQSQDTPGNNLGNNEVTMKYFSSNNEVTHIQEDKKIRREEERSTSSSKIFLLNIPQLELEELARQFSCTQTQVVAKAASLYDYCQAKGKVYKDYRALLRNALRRDFGIRTAAPQFTPDLPKEISKEGLEKLNNMKKKVFGDKFGGDLHEK